MRAIYRGEWRWLLKKQPFFFFTTYACIMYALCRVTGHFLTTDCREIVTQLVVLSLNLIKYYS